jgi:Glycine rich protein/Secretion system C-terminal sorting domain
MKRELLQPIKVILLAILLGLNLNVLGQTTTFNYTGAVQTYTVPVGVTSLTFVAEGASGGLSAWAYWTTTGSSDGGFAAHVTGTVNVTPGQVLDVYVGGLGANGVGTVGGAGGYNGGGNGAYVYSGGDFAGGGGGGASDIRFSPYGLADRVVVAAGSGGGGSDAYPVNSMNGGDGGTTTGGDGFWEFVTTFGHGGHGATTGAPGAGGTFGGWGSGSPGTLGVGGIAGSPSGGGGGGGGRYGGGGGSWGGGGGGSSYADPVSTVGPVYTIASSHTTNGYVTLTPNTPPVNSIPYFVNPSPEALSVCQNSSPTSINALMAIIDSNVGNTETWTIVLNPVHGNLSGFPFSTASVGMTPTTPTGMTYQPTPGYSGLDSFKVQVSDGLGGIATTTVIVTINPLPYAAPITGPTTVCQAANILLLDAAPGGTWSSMFGYASVAPTTGLVTGITAGVETITYTVSNSCGTATATYLVTVNALAPVGTITGPTSVCTGWTITLADAVPGGSWSATNGNATVVAGVVTGVTVGLDTIRYSIANSCGVNSALYEINVMSLPDPGVITGPASVCVGATISLTDAVSGGIWMATNSKGTMALSGDFDGHVKGLDTVTYAVTNMCGTSIASKTINIIDVPVVSAISGSSKVCEGATIVLTDATTGGVWAHSNSSTTVSAGGVVTGITAGASVISYTVTNACGTTTVTKNIEILMSPTSVVITGDTVVCPDQYDPMTASFPGGVWSITNNHAYIDETGVVGGVRQGWDTVLYTVTNQCGTGSAKFPVYVLSDSICHPVSVKPLVAGEVAMKVYPNPNDGAFTLILSSGTNEPVQVIITNVVGQKVFSTITTTNKSTDIRMNVPAGVYVLTAYTANGMSVAKITVD